MVRRMYILGACDDGDVLNGVRMLVIFMNIFRTVVPLIIIGMGIKDLMAVVTGNKDGQLKTSLSQLAKRIIAGLIVFMLPTLIDALLDILVEDGTSYQYCIENATPEGIQKAYYNTSLKMLETAKEDLDAGELQDALGYAKRKVEDSGQLQEIQSKYEKIRGYLDIQDEISIMTKKDQYNDLKSKVNGIDDSNVKAKLLDKLEKKYRTLNEKEGKLRKERDTDGPNGSSSNVLNSNPNMADAGLTGEIVKQEETETLKVVIRKSGTYYTTQVWVKDPYNQLNKYDSPNYGRQTLHPGYLLKKAVEERGLSDKLVVGFNASGFYLKNVYDAASVNYYPAYDKTSVGTLVITDGKVVRNAYDKAYKTWYIAGVDKKGTLNIYTDSKTTDANAKKQWSETVIGEIRNTFTFASPLVENGQASTDTTSMPSPNGKPKRQAICQIDGNNFLLITGSELSRQDLIDIMLSAKCQTGTNFDGGGSIALLWKSKNSTTIDTVVGNNRDLTEVGYFSEQ